MIYSDAAICCTKSFHCYLIVNVIFFSYIKKGTLIVWVKE